jgi:hypothetical protein
VLEMLWDAKRSLRNRVGIATENWTLPTGDAYNGSVKVGDYHHCDFGRRALNWEHGAAGNGGLYNSPQDFSFSRTILVNRSVRSLCTNWVHHPNAAFW